MNSKKTKKRRRINQQKKENRRGEKEGSTHTSNTIPIFNINIQIDYFQDKITHPQYTSNMQIHSLQNNIHVSKVHCGSAVRFGQALLGYLITAHHLYVSLR